MVFDQPGAVKLGCNIHDWMSGVILVVPTSYFASTDASGIHPARRPRRCADVAAWHENSQTPVETTAQRVDAAGAPPLTFTLDTAPAARPARRRGAELRVSTWWAQRRLRTRIFLPFAFLLLALLLATLWIINAAVGSWVARSLEAQFAVTGRVFGEVMAERAARLAGITGLLVQDFAFKRAVATYDSDTLASMAANERYRDIDLLWITDADGKLLADFAGRVPRGRPVGTLPPLSAALASERGQAPPAIAAVDGHLFELVAAPVKGPDQQPIGFLLAGEAIDDDTARALQRDTGPAVSLPPRRALRLVVARRAAQSALPGGHPTDGPLAKSFGGARSAATLVTVGATGSSPV